MTATSVKDVGSMLSQGIRGAGAVKSGGGAFQTVWNSQAGADRAPQQNQAARTSDATVKAKPGDELRAKENPRKGSDGGMAGKVKNAGQDEMSPEELQDAAEQAATAVMELMRQIAEAFGITQGDVEALMADMDLQPMDLLEPGKLGSLLLAAGGDGDPLSLITDEQLCADYQALMEQGRAISETLGVSPEVLTEKLAQTSEEIPEQPAVTEAAVETAEPMIVVETEDAQETDETHEPQETQDVFRIPDGGADSSPEGVTARTAQARPDADGREEKEAGQGGHEGNAMNLSGVAAQEPQDTLFGLRTEEAQRSEGPWDIDAQDVMRQIMDYMKIQVRQNVSSLEMQLHPANLGTLQIHVAAKGGVLTASFITQNETVRAALESQMVQLRESFEEQGVKVEAIEVTVQTHQFEQNLEQGRGGQSGEMTEGKRPRTRRLSLGGESGTAVPEELEGDERIAAEMMAANGGTVDFTA